MMVFLGTTSPMVTMLNALAVMGIRALAAATRQVDTESCVYSRMS